MAPAAGGDGLTLAEAPKFRILLQTDLVLQGPSVDALLRSGLVRARAGGRGGCDGRGYAG